MAHSPPPCHSFLDRLGGRLGGTPWVLEGGSHCKDRTALAKLQTRAQLEDGKIIPEDQLARD
jgi:hypothetical protein